MSRLAWVGADAPVDAALLGGKGAGLAFLTAAGARVPPAFVLTTEAYRAAVGDELRAELDRAVAELDPGAPGGELERAAEGLRRRVLEATEGHALSDELAAAYAELAERTGEPEPAVAVRSSSAAEDAGDQSFAGEHDTYLWVSGLEELDARVRACWASLLTTRAIVYRRRGGGGPATSDAMAVVVQQMAPARAAGVFMTLNPVNGDRSKVMVEAVWGLGEPLVAGEVDPDRWLVDKVTGDVLRADVALKPTEAARAPGGQGVEVRDVPAERREQPSLSEAELTELVRLARLVERRAGAPQDGEFAVVDGEAPDNVRLLQCRPETAWSRRERAPVAGGRTGALAQVMDALKGG